MVEKLTKADKELGQFPAQTLSEVYAVSGGITLENIRKMKNSLRKVTIIFYDRFVISNLGPAEKTQD